MIQRSYKVMDAHGKESPPVDEAHLFDLARRGFLPPATMIYDVADDRWFKAGDHPALKAIFRQHPPASPNPPRPPTPPPLPVGVSANAPVQPVHVFAYEEYVHQYVSLNWYLLLGFLGFITGPIGIGLILYAFFQKPALRRKLAEMGVDPNAFAGDAAMRFWRGIGPWATIVLSVICYVWAYSAWISSHSKREVQEEPYTRSQEVRDAWRRSRATGMF